MPSVVAANMPDGALLAAYANAGAYTDCYRVLLDREVSFAEYMEAFYTTPLFKVERWILSGVLRLPSTDHGARELARGSASEFAAWRVESRKDNQVILAAGPTRSWLMACPQASGAGKKTALYFGSAVVPRRPGGMGWHFGLLLGFHKLYSRLLLRAAARHLTLDAG